MLNLLINLVTSRVPAVINAVLFGGAVANEATTDLITQITNVTSLELLGSIVAVAGVQYLTIWLQRRFGGKSDTGGSN